MKEIDEFNIKFETFCWAIMIFYIILVLGRIFVEGF